MKNPWFLLVCMVVQLGAQAATETTVAYTDFDGTQRNVDAVVSEPASGAGGAKVPAVVILHSRAGWPPGFTHQYAELFSQHGAVAVELKMFDGTPANPLRYLSQVYATLNQLAGRQDVDRSRIYVMGMSYGASLSIYAATSWAAERYGKPGLRFAKFASLYPTCFFHEGIVARDSKIAQRMKGFGFPDDFHDRWQDAPVRIFQGADDRYDDADPKACEKFVQRIPDPTARTRFDVTVWPGATHGWDQPGSKTVFDPLGCRFKGCDASFAFNGEVAQKTKAELLGFFSMVQ